MCHTYFKHKCIHRYTKVGRGSDVMEVMSIIALLLRRSDTVKCVHHVNTRRLAIQKSSDHSVQLCKFKFLGTCIKRMEEVNRGGIIRIENLREQQCKEPGRGNKIVDWDATK